MPDEDLAANRVESVDDEVNVLGDQDALNTQSAYQYPADAHNPTAQNVRRYPELFNEDVIASFDVENPDHVEATDADVDVDDDVLADDSEVNAETPSGEPLDATTIEGDGDTGDTNNGDSFDSPGHVTY